MAATPILAIPYPIGTDRVMDGDNAMQAMAQRLEALLETRPRGSLGAWTALPAGATPTQGAIDVFGTKTVTIGNGRIALVHVSVLLIRASAGDYSVVQLKVDGADWHATNVVHSSAGTAMGTGFTTYIGGTGAARTLQVQAFRAAGNGNISLGMGGAVLSNTLLVHDIGTGGPPAGLLTTPEGEHHEL